MLVTVIAIVAIAGLMLSTVQLSRIQILSEAIRAEIQRVGDERLNIINNGGSREDVVKVKYPDINQSHRNLKWYKPWERPSTLVVFEKD